MTGSYAVNTHFRAGRRVRSTGLMAGAATVLVLTGACGGSGGGSASATAPDSFSYLSVTENTTVQTALTTLSEGACSAAAADLPLEIETVPQSDLDQKLQLLAGQDALPVQYAAGNAPALTQELADAGQVADLEAELTDLGVYDQLEPSAVSTIKALYGDRLDVLPYEYNIEGIFYNKSIFSDNGIEVPTTWDDLVAAADTLEAAGIQAFSASGEQGWPLTRMISGYLYRSLGPDALQAVADGTAKLTDPEYVAAAQAVADLGAAGYFGEGVGSIDYDTSINEFLTGKAGMMYMGSWLLSNIADTEQNTIGADAVGFMPFPEVSGGAGAIDQYPSNVGLGIALNASTFDDNTGAWVSCIAKNYGSTALADQGVISGFKVNDEVEDANQVTTQIRDTISSSDQSVLWFEALFSTKATNVSQSNAASLVSGSMTAEEFMQKVQDALD